jgi:hypothetical protein
MRGSGLFINDERAAPLLPPKAQCTFQNRMECFFKPGCSWEPSAGHKCIRTNCLDNNSEYACHRYCDCEWDNMSSLCHSDFNNRAISHMQHKYKILGGGGSNKIRILGRERVIRKVGRKQYVMYKGSLLPLKDARELEKTLGGLR